MVARVTTANEEIENLRAAVARHFQVSGTVVSPLSLVFQVSPPTGSVDGPFEALRREIMPQGYVPFIYRERGELVVHIQRRPPQRFASTNVNLIMLVITILTTLFLGGAYNWSEYANVPLLSLDALLWGTVYFSVPLLAILGLHEMGHYVVAKRYHVQASLPFFLPSVPPLGTFGAFISMRDPLPSRRALVDIGAAGPLVGFAIAIPVTLAGMYLTVLSPHAIQPVAGEFQLFQPSLFYGFLHLFFPFPDNVALHPLAFAGWVGLFITGANLLPAGQLDGGHIARALLGRRQYLVSWAALAIMIGLGVVYGSGTWLLFGLLILFLGPRHPPPLNDLTSLGAGRTAIGLLAVAVLILTFIPQPIAFVPATHGLAFQNAAGGALTQLTGTASLGSTAVLTFYLNDTTSAAEDVNLSIDPNNLRNLNNAGFSLAFADVTIDTNVTTYGTPWAVIHFTGSAKALVHLDVVVPASLPRVPSTWPFTLTASVPATGDSVSLPVTLTVT